MNCFLFLLGQMWFVLSLCLWGLSSCNSVGMEADCFHPIWCYVNEDEGDQACKDKCMVTKFGWQKLRFHVSDVQKCLNSGDFCKLKENIVETNTDLVNWVLTPCFYGCVTNEKFPATMQAGIKYKYNLDKYKYNNGEMFGMPVQFLDELLAIEDHKDAIVILSTGINDKLGISKALEEKLKIKKEKGEIQDYFIKKSVSAVALHNRYVKKGQKTFTFIHTAG